MQIAMMLAACAVASGVLTGLVRRYAISRAILDIPNDRSSHTSPTPRGGGLAIALVLLGALIAAGLIDLIEQDLVLALAGGGSLVATTGWVDDRGHVPAHLRALAHFTAAGWAVWALGGLESLRLGGGVLALGPLGSVLAVLGVVWLLNLYNFMDGIDGIAAGEALLVGIVGGGLAWMSGSPSVAFAALLAAATSAGFLAWNWAPAKIFMGDIGSGLLGFVFGVLAVASEASGSVPLVLWLVLLGTFVFDATATLLRRVLRRERWYDAHRSHAYQRAVRGGASHAHVTSGALTVTVILGALATAGALRMELQLAAVLAAVLLLGAVYVWVERLWPMYSERGAQRTDKRVRA